MSVKEITTDELRKSVGKEGIIFQGCGGDPQEWVDGINDELTKVEILKNGTKFDGASKFTHDDLTCLLFEFTDKVDLDIGKLAMWRLKTHEVFGGTWLSDYVTNRLDGFVETDNESAQTEKTKPDCALIGQDGNIYNLVGIASRTLKKNGLKDEAKEMSERVFSSGSYNEALCIIGEYVNITDGEGMNEECEFGMNM